MAAPVNNQVGNGSTKDFDVTFPYINKTHVKVYVNYVATPISVWLTSSRIRLAVAPAVGVEIIIRRETPAVPVVTIQNNKPTPAADYNTLTLQAIYLSQEQWLDKGSLGTEINDRKAAILAEAAARVSGIATEAFLRNNSDVAEAAARAAADEALAEQMDVILPEVTVLTDRAEDAAIDAEATALTSSIAVTTATALVAAATAGFTGFPDGQSYDFGSVADATTYFNQDWGTV